MRYLEAGRPDWNLVGWVLRSAVIDRRRLEGKSTSLSGREKAGVLEVTQPVASLAYARCMILTGLGIAVAMVFIVPARALPRGAVRSSLFGLALCIAALPAASQLVVLAWFSAQGGPYKTRMLRTAPASLRRAGIFAWALSLIGGVIFAVAMYKSRA